MRNIAGDAVLMGNNTEIYALAKRVLLLLLGIVRRVHKNGTKKLYGKFSDAKN